MKEPIRKALLFVDRTTGFVDRIVQIAVVAVFVVLFALLNLQVGMRYVIRVPLIWLEELAGFLLAYLALWGSSSCIRSDKHVVVTILPDRITSARVRHWLSIAVHACLAFYLYYLTVYGYQFAALGAGEVTPSGSFDFFVPRLSLFTGGILMLIQTANVMIGSAIRLTGFEPPDATGEPDRP